MAKKSFRNSIETLASKVEKLKRLREVADWMGSAQIEREVKELMEAISLLKQAEK